MRGELILATDDGVMAAAWRDGRAEMRQRGLAGRRIRCAAARGDGILVGTTQGIFRSEDRGQSWHEANQGLAHPHVRWLAIHPDEERVALAGTEPAGIFVSDDGGRRWNGCPEVEALRDANGWYLPYSPEAGCVRGFAFGRDRIYAAVEQGGLLQSADNGRSWSLVAGSTGTTDKPAPGRLHPDVHSVQADPNQPERILAPTGGGFYRSDDGGTTWRRLYECYCRAVWANPDEPEHLLLGPADGVSKNGRIEQSHDGGETWQAASEGLEVPWPKHMVERFTPLGPHLLAVLSGGHVLATERPSAAWQRILSDVPKVNACAWVAD